jgi:ribosome-binding factor A
VPQGFDRRLRIADLMKHELGKLLLSHSHDPRFTFVSITSIDISKDYSHAKVYVTILDEEKTEEIMAALNKAAGFFRHHLAQAVNLRSTPKLIFHFDETIRKGQRISQLLSQTSKKPSQE